MVSVRCCTTSPPLKDQEEHATPATSAREAVHRIPPTSFCFPPPPFSLQPPSYGNAGSNDIFRIIEKNEAVEENSRKGETTEWRDDNAQPSPLPSARPGQNGEGDGHEEGGEHSTLGVPRSGSGTAEITSSSLPSSPSLTVPATPPTVPPLVGNSFLLWSPFVLSTVDLHQALLLEAHEKHGVDLDVPPQAPPSSASVSSAEPLSPASTNEAAKQEEELRESEADASQNALSMAKDALKDASDSASTEETDSPRSASPPSADAFLFHPPTPTAVPVPFYPPALARKMKDVAAHFQYTPTHGPPPLHTTGSHTLADSWHLSSGASGGVQSQQQLRSWRSRYQRALVLRQAEWKAMWQLHRKKLDDPRQDLGVIDGPSSSSSATSVLCFLEEEEKMEAHGHERLPQPKGDVPFVSSGPPETPDATVHRTEASTTARSRSTPSSPSPTMDADVIRAPVQEGMRCHCRVCGRGYRQKEVAVEHVRLRHAEQLLNAASTVTRLSDASAGEGGKDENDVALSFVLDGPGMGEIVAVITNDSSPTPAPVGRRGKPLSNATTTAPSSSPLDGGGAGEEQKEEGAHTVPAKATPAGAARALKRRLATASGSSTAASPTIGVKGGVGGSGRKKGLTVAPSAASTKGSGTPLQRLSIRERSLLYSNPFGAAAEAAAEAAKLEEQEPVNPFKEIPESVTSSGMEPKKKSVELDGGGTTREKIEETKCTQEKEEAGQGAAWSSSSSLATALHGTTLYRDIGEPSRFYCPLCLRHSRGAAPLSLSPLPQKEGFSPPFSSRLLDSLLDHLEVAHAEEGGVDALEPETLQALYDQQNYPWRAKKKSISNPHHPLLPTDRTPSCPTPTGANAPTSSGVPPASTPVVQGKNGVPDEKETHDGEDSTRDTTHAIASSAVEEVLHSSMNEKGSDRHAQHLSPSVAPKMEGTIAVTSSSSSTTPAAENLSIRLHARLLCTTLLRGIVMDVQHGYMAKRLVLQYVVKVIGREKSNKNANEGGVSTTVTDASGENKGNGKGVASSGDEEELIVVRYQGEPTSFTALRSSIHVGADVVAMGNLRLDRRLDTLSKRYHAYPVVIIVPPFGSIRAVS